MLDLVKKALRITTNSFNDELNHLIDSALIDLGFGGAMPEVLVVTTDTDPIIAQAVITYCKMNFGEVEDGFYDRLKASYDEQKSQMLMSSTFTEWGLDNA